MKFDLQPLLCSDSLILRPLVAADRERLWEVARDPLIWEQHPDNTRCEPEGYERFIEGSLDSGSALVIVEAKSGKIIGSARYYDWDPVKREVAIGYTFLARAFWGGATNRELKRLMIQHAGKWASRIWFHVGKDNLRSRRAMEKIGGKAEFEARRPLNGQMIPFIYYSIDPAEWR